MRREHRFTFPLAHGLHARPASLFAEVAEHFVAVSSIVSEATGETADVRSVLSMVALDIQLGAECRLIVEGEDAEQAMECFRRLLAELPERDGPADVASGEASGAPYVPPGLRTTGASFIFGRGVSPGVGEGVAVIIAGLSLTPEDLRPKGEIAVERARLQNAFAGIRADLQKRSRATTSGIEADILRAHLAIANDPSLRERAHGLVAQGASAEQAIVSTAEHFAARLRGAASEYIRDRVADVQDISQQALARLGVTAAPLPALRERSIIVAEMLTPGQLLAMERTLIAGLLLGATGATSHTVLLARSFQIPAIIDVRRPTGAVAHGDWTIVDAGAGFGVSAVNEGVRKYYDRHIRTLSRRRARLTRFNDVPAVTSDGKRLEIGANVSTQAELAPAFAMGAEGIGLFRTEMLFLDRDFPPGEEEQLAVYRAAAEHAAGKAVIIRAFDIGGDKAARYLPMPEEENPFLGQRGIRLYSRFPDLLRTQLRAILRAAVGGSLKVMAPMVSTPAEAKWFREQVEASRESLRADGLAFAEKLPIGVMVEVPAVAMAMEELCRHAEFLSVGSNDLTQYWFAIDRANTNVARIASPRDPSFLRLLKIVTDQARRLGRWIGICGDMARERAHLPLLLALGFDEISVPAPDIAPLKSTLARISTERAVATLDAALLAADAEEVGQILAGAARTTGEDLLDAELILADSDAATKEEAIKDLVDAMFIKGRTEDPLRLERAVWAREATYSTGLGHAIAVPHCKSDAILTASIGVARLRSGVEWGSLDVQPVRLVILLAMRESDGEQLHLKVFSRLARRLVHEEFRARLMGAPDAAAILTTLRAELGPATDA